MKLCCVQHLESRASESFSWRKTGFCCDVQPVPWCNLDRTGHQLEKIAFLRFWGVSCWLFRPSADQIYHLLQLSLERSDSMRLAWSQEVGIPDRQVSHLHSYSLQHSFWDPSPDAISKTDGPSWVSFALGFLSPPKALFSSLHNLAESFCSFFAW